MAENGRPKSKATDPNKPKKPLGPIKMYVLFPPGTNADQILLIKSRREMLDALVANRDLNFKEFVFERTARDGSE